MLIVNYTVYTVRMYVPVLSHAYSTVVLLALIGITPLLLNHVTQGCTIPDSFVLKATSELKIPWPITVEAAIFTP